MNTKMRIVLGALFLALMTAAFIGITYARFSRLTASYDGWTARRGDGRSIITSIDKQGPAQALRVGDEVVSLNGISPKEQPDILNNNARQRPGTRYTMVVRRDGQLLEFSLELTGFPIGNWSQAFLQSLVAFLFLATGLILFALKPADKQALLLALMLSSFVSLISGNGAGLPRWGALVVATARIGGSFVLPFFLHFFLVFPDHSPWLRRFPRLHGLIYLPFLLLVYPVQVVSVLGAFGFPLPGSGWLQGRGWLIVSGVVAVGYMVLGLISLVVNYRASDAAARRRARVAVIGSGAGFLDLFVLVVGQGIGLGAKFPTLFSWLDIMQLFTLPLIPLSFAYAIVRHKVIPVSLILRRGVRYLLVSRGSVLLEVIAVILAVTGLLTFVFSRIRSSGLVIGIVSAAVGIGAWRVAERLHQKYLAPLIDRKFFRQSYDSHQIIADLADSLRQTTDLSHLSEQVATRIQTALQTESVVVLLRDDATGDYLSDYSCEYSAGEGRAVASQQRFRLPRFAETAGKLAETRQPIEVEWNGSPSIESDALRQMKSSLLLPLAGKDGMPGIISLGPRLGDVPYSREDKRLLMSVAGPTTFAIENARLVERMIEEARRREEIEAENEARAKELEEARQLQLSMLPKRLPELPGLEIAAYMKTATEVGGDYYDFHLGGDGTLTVMVGDATGHGLKAGTVVTATKSLLNHLAGSDDIPAIFQQSSRALKQMNLRGLFMAMTMVKLNGSRLTIGVAGMPPMLVYRATERRVEEVSIQAMPLGSLTNIQYVQRQIDLSRGDIVLLMSDGFPERFNPRGELLEMAAAADVLLAHAASPPQTIIDALIHAGDQWADGTAQNDDVTFVVLKLR